MYLTDIHRFVTTTEPLGPAAQIAAFRAELTDQGSDMTAAPADTTDGYAVALFGLQAIGISEGDACRQWLCMARTQIGGWPEPDETPTLRAAQIIWAIHIIANQMHCSRDHLHQACKIVQHLSTNRILRHAADTLARAQHLFADQGQRA